MFWLAAVAVFFLALLVVLGIRYDRRVERMAVEGVEDEPHDEEPVFQNLPNFRQAGGTSLYNGYGQKVRDGLLFRSSRTDFLTDTELEQFLELEIKSIIDLRILQEYANADGGKILDSVYQIHIVKKGKITDSHKDLSKLTSTDFRGKRYMFNMVTREHIIELFSHFNFAVRLFALVLLAFDKLLGTRLALKLGGCAVCKNYTMAEWYMSLLEHSKPVVADILRLLLDASNVPVLIHCAYGKDRTGVIIALILGCLEVEHEVIATDYALSQSGLGSIRKRLYWESVGKLGLKRDFALATPDTMRDLLTEISKRYGSIPGYLSAAGFTVDEQQALKDIFLETC